MSREAGGSLETSLVARARAGDVDAFEELVRDRADRVVRLAMAIVADETEARDVAQEAFIAAWRQLHGAARPRALRCVADPDRREPGPDGPACPAPPADPRDPGRRDGEPAGDGQLAPPDRSTTAAPGRRGTPGRRARRARSGSAGDPRACTTSKVGRWPRSRRPSRSPIGTVKSRLFTARRRSSTRYRARATTDRGRPDERRSVRAGATTGTTRASLPRIARWPRSASSSGLADAVAGRSGSRPREQAAAPIEPRTRSEPTLEEVAGRHDASGRRRPCRPGRGPCAPGSRSPRRSWSSRWASGSASSARPRRRPRWPPSLPRRRASTSTTRHRGRSTTSSRRRRGSDRSGRSWARTPGRPRVARATSTATTRRSSSRGRSRSMSASSYMPATDVDLCTRGATGSDLQGRGPDDPIATRTLDQGRGPPRAPHDVRRRRQGLLRFRRVAGLGYRTRRHRPRRPTSSMRCSAARAPRR